MITLLSVCIIPSVSHANESQQGEKKAKDPTELFKKLDADNSGSLSGEEVAKNKRLTKRFQKIDSNKDGALSLEELKAGSAKKPKKTKSEDADDSEE
jgi:Ca2+-binding EF-hand superfamily protein